MSNFKTFTTLTIAALFAAPAFAQDKIDAPALEVTPDIAVTHFTSADLDQDGALNADEFVTFAVMQAEAGDTDFQDLVLSGEYNTKFIAHDKDASGGLSAEELGHAKADPKMKSDAMDSEDDLMDAPELN